jgi:hypothetical protein
MHQQIDFLAQWLSYLQEPLHSRISELWAELPAVVRHWLLKDGDGLAASAWHDDEFVKGSSCEPIQGAGEETSIGYDSPSDDDADPETEFCADNSQNEDGHDDPSDPTTSTHDPVTGAVVDPTTWPTGLKTTGPGDQYGCEGLREFWFEIKQELGLSAWVSQIVGSNWPESSDFLSKAHELMADFCPSKNVGSDNSQLG